MDDRATRIRRSARRRAASRRRQAPQAPSTAGESYGAEADHRAGSERAADDLGPYETRYEVRRGYTVDRTIV